MVQNFLGALLKLRAKILKYGVVGAIGVGADVLSSNLLWHFSGLSLTVAGIGGTCIATVTAYLGSRFWVFGDRPADGHPLVLFVLVSLIGLVIENGFVFTADHILGLHSQLAANIAKFGFGLVVAGAFRFTAFNLFVFPEARPHVVDDDELSASSPTVANAP